MSTNRWKRTLSHVCRIIFVIIMIGSCSTNRVQVRKEQPISPLSYSFVELHSGDSITLNGLLENHGVVLISFWGIMCESCLEEIKVFNKMFEDKFRGSVAFLSVNTDGLGTDALKQEIAKRNIKINYLSVADPGMVLTGHFTSGYVPHNVVLTGSGDRKLEITGYNGRIIRKIEEILFTCLVEMGKNPVVAPSIRAEK